MLTRERVEELAAELSLIDLCRLVLAKAVGPNGLSAQGGASMEVEIDGCKLTLRRRVRKAGKTNG